MEIVVKVNEKEGKGVFGARDLTIGFMQNFLNKHKGHHVRVIMKRAINPNQRQFNYLYGVIYPFIQGLFKIDTGEKIKIEEIDYFFKRRFWYEEVACPLTGEITITPKLKRKMNKAELTQYIQDIAIFCTEQWNCEIPSVDLAGAIQGNDEQDFSFDSEISIIDIE